jgi:hypothetical protein
VAMAEATCRRETAAAQSALAIEVAEAQAQALVTLAKVAAEAEAARFEAAKQVLPTPTATDPALPTATDVQVRDVFAKRCATTTAALTTLHTAGARRVREAVRRGGRAERARVQKDGGRRRRAEDQGAGQGGVRRAHLPEGVL